MEKKVAGVTQVVTCNIRVIYIYIYYIVMFACIIHKIATH